MHSLGIIHNACLSIRYKKIKDLKNSKGLYLLFYFFYLMVIVTAFFFKKEVLVYVKPFTIISLAIIYITQVSKIEFLYILSLLIIVINDTLVYIDFVGYFDEVAITISIFYVICVFLLKDYIAFGDIKIKKHISFPVVISLVLIVYLTYSISELVLPNLKQSLIPFFTVMLLLFCFVTVCFSVYITDEYKGNFRLFISASCCLFTCALLLINFYYYYITVFIVLINIAEIAGHYFFMEFLIKAKKVDKNLATEDYL